MNSKIDPPPSTIGAVVLKFHWPDGERSLEERNWRIAAKNAMTWILREEVYGPGYCDTQEKMTSVQNLTDALTVKNPERPTSDLKESVLQKQWAYAWERSRSHIFDRRYCVDFFARHIARQQFDVNISTAFPRIGMVYVSNWIDRIITQAWDETIVPSWLNSKVLMIVRGEAQSPDRVTRSMLKSLHPWKEAQGYGIQEDLDLFLKAFCETRTSYAHEPFRMVKMSQMCVLLRALHLVDPEKISKNTVGLLDQMEGLLDMNLLREGNHVDQETYSVVRAVWDQRILSEDQTVPDTHAPKGQRKRIL